MNSDFYIKILKDDRKTLYLDPLNIKMIEVEISEFSTPENKILKFGLTLNISPHYIEAYVDQKDYRDHENWLSSKAYREVNKRYSIELVGWPFIRKLLKPIEGQIDEVQCL